MTVGELIEQLQDLIDCEEASPDAEVRLAVQPGWPFEHALGRVVVPAPRCGECDVESGLAHGDGCPDGPGLVGGSAGDDDETAKTVYLGEAGQLGYLPSTVREALGWGE